MKELSYHILDIANNSVRGKATEIKIEVVEEATTNIFSLTITDNGIGIPDSILSTIKDPFTTSRTFRKVGLGIPFLNDTCINCGGKLDISSKVGEGTLVYAVMELNHIDRPPLGNIASTMTTLISSEESINIIYSHTINGEQFELSSNDIREVLGDVPLNRVEVIIWLKEYLVENIKELRV